MKMLKNGHEVDAFATSRIPIQSPRSMKRVDVLRCAARPPVRPVHDPPDHLAEDGVVAVAVDGVAALREQKGYKNRDLPAIVPKCVVVVDTRWLGNANARLDVDDPPPNDDGVVK